MHFKKLFKIPLLQTDCESRFVVWGAVLNQFLSAAVNVAGKWLISRWSVLFTDMGRTPGGSSGKIAGLMCQERLQRYPH